MKKMTTFLTSTVIFLSINAAWANSNSEENINALSNEASQYFSEGRYSQESGDNPSACISYKKAETAWNKAMWEVPGLGTESGFNSQKANAALDAMMNNIGAAREHAAMVCGKDAVSVPGSSSLAREQNFDPDYDSKMDVQATVSLAAEYAKAAYTKYEADDFAGSCASSRLSAEAFGAAARALKANANLSSAFANAEQVYENAKQSVLDRDEFYCEGQLVASVTSNLAQPVTFVISPETELKSLLQLGLGHVKDANAKFDNKEMIAGCESMRLAAAVFATSKIYAHGHDVGEKLVATTDQIDAKIQETTLSCAE